MNSRLPFVLLIYSMVVFTYSLVLLKVALSVQFETSAKYCSATYLGGGSTFLNRCSPKIFGRFNASINLLYTFATFFRR